MLHQETLHQETLHQEMLHQEMARAGVQNWRSPASVVVEDVIVGDTCQSCFKSSDHSNVSPIGSFRRCHIGETSHACHGYSERQKNRQKPDLPIIVPGTHSQAFVEVFT
jgi:hypothetical protein